MSRKNITRQRVTTVVAGASTIATTGASIVGTGKAYNISNGQLSVLAAGTENTNPDMWKIQSGAGDINGTNTIYLAQGTPLSSNMSMEHTMLVGDRSLVKTDKIPLNGVRIVSCKKPELGVYEVEREVLSSVTANTLYKASVRLKSVNFDATQGVNTRKIVAAYNSGASGTVNTVLHNLGSKLNLQTENTLQTQEAPFVVFGYATGAVGSYSTLISAIQEGTSIPFLVDSGVTYNYVATKDFVNTLTKLVTAGALLTTNSLVAMDATTPTVINGLLAFGLDHLPHYGVDLEPRVKVGLELNITGATRTRLLGAFEGTGKGSVLALAEQERSLLQVNNFNFFPSLSHNVNTFSYVNPSLLYTETNIEYVDEQRSLSTIEEWEKKVTILCPATITNPTAFAGTAYTITTTTIPATINPILGAWLARSPTALWVGDAVKSTNTIVAA